MLESLVRGSWPRVDAVLLSPERGQFYTGMVPGFLQGQYDQADLTIDLPSLCAAAGATFVSGSAIRVRTRQMEVDSSAGALPYDLLSLDIGSVPLGQDVPGVREHALTVRPLERAVTLRARVEAAGAGAEAARVAVVGGGAGGVEIAFAVHRLLGRGAHPGSVTLVERGNDILTGYPARARDRVRRLFRTRGIVLLVDATVESVEADYLCLADGRARRSDLVIWATGPAAPPLIRHSALPQTEDGFLKVDRTLRGVGDERVWGAGDCATIEGLDVPKSGVYAVREGAVLARNLRAALEGKSPAPYRPQQASLSILNTGDDEALLRWRGFVAHGRLAWRLKDWIDRRWVRRFETESHTRWPLAST